MTIEGAALVLGCKRTKVFELIRLRKITTCPKIGRQRMVLRASVLSILNAAPILAPSAPAHVETPGLSPENLKAEVLRLFRGR